MEIVQARTSCCIEPFMCNRPVLTLMSQIRMPTSKDLRALHADPLDGYVYVLPNAENSPVGIKATVLQPITAIFVLPIYRIIELAETSKVI